MKRLRRAAAIVRRLVPFVFGFLRDRRRWVLLGPPRALTPEAHQRRADRLSGAIAALGPTFIKLAQVFSARADILPEPYLSAIGRLQDRVPPDPARAIEAVIAEDLDAAVDDVLEAFDREPVAAASLGQVHRARYRGQDVAVKVLRPGVEDLVAVDLEISFRVLFVLNILFPNHHVRALTNLVREFSVRVQEEMDFRQEARNMKDFHQHFGDDVRVRAPAVFHELTRRRVLVMEWVDGDKVDRLHDRFASGDLDRDRFLENLGEIYLRMLLVAGFLHADPHPGNILVERDGTMVFLDWGMVVRTGRQTRDRIIRLALAVGREDLNGMTDEMYALGMIEPEVARGEIRDAAAEILEIVSRAREVGARRVQETVQEILDTFYVFPLQLPRELVYFFRAAALLEGIGLRYDEAFNGLDVARPVIRRMRWELIRSTTRDPGELARDVADDARAGLHAVRELLRRAEREEFRIRFHPRDIREMQRFSLLQARRILLSVFALTIALIAAITFLALRNVYILAAALLIAFVMFIVVFFLPTHLLENPLRHARGIRPPDRTARRRESPAGQAPPAPAGSTGGTPPGGGRPRAAS